MNSYPKYVVIGAGFFGSVIAERIANDMNEKVMIIDKRNHIGGNSYSEIDEESGIECHKYGSHIFHTSNEEVWNYVNTFSKFNDYKHRVMTVHNNKTYSMPINLATINNFFQLNLNPAAAEKYIKDLCKINNILDPKNLEEKAISLIGKELYEAFIKGYTQKQWETELTSLSPDIITRLPVRYNYNDRYFSDTYEGIPVDGYTKLFERMLSSSKNIEVVTGIDFFDIKNLIDRNKTKIIYTGPLDRYFEFKFGKLGWRTVDFEKEVHEIKDYQGTSVINYADLEIPYTRIHEFKHFHPERKCFSSNKTVIYKEYSRFSREDELPYYPINTSVDKKIYDAYKDLADKETNLIVGGRLGSYKYLDMHQAIGAALLLYKKEIKQK